MTDHVAARLATPTRQQLMLQGAWAKDALQLHLFAAQDFTAISEARYLVAGGTAERSNLCLRGANAEQIVAKAADYALALAKGAAEQLASDSVIVQIAFETTGRVSILDINPSLTPAQVAMLMQPA